MTSIDTVFRGPLGIARAGHLQIVTSAIAAALLGLAVAPWVGHFAWVCALLPGFVTFFFRDPERRTREDPRALLAPADGRVDDIGTVAECAFFPGPATRIGIYLSLWSVHVQRAPCRAVAVSVVARPGKRVATRRVGDTDDNEHCVSLLRRGCDRHPEGDPSRPIVVRQVAGPIACGIVNTLVPGRTIDAGARFGLIRFGSRVEVFVPVDHVRVSAQPGDRVRAGISILGGFAEFANARPDAASSALLDSFDPRTP